MLKTTLAIILSIILLNQSAFAWNDCPKGLENDPYPGECAKYIDTDGDGICDHSQLPPEEREIDNNEQEKNLITNEENTVNIKNNNNPYNIIFPFFTSITLYLITYLLSKQNYKWFNKSKFNFLWNTILIISLIPSVIFGFYLILRYTYPKLNNINFNFLYWHVEGSVVFGTITILHIISRLKQYNIQIDLLKK